MQKYVDGIFRYKDVYFYIKKRVKTLEYKHPEHHLFCLSEKKRKEKLMIDLLPLHFQVCWQSLF